MDHPIRILNDNQGQVTAVVDINGTEYTFKLHTLGLTTAQRNKRVRELAQEQAKADTVDQTINRGVI